MEARRRKQLGAYYTPDDVVRSLVSWAVRSPDDRMLDPSCGDGRFLVEHDNSVGVEQDPLAAAAVHERTPGCLLHEGDFFSWASDTHERFECAAGNPPFIRYQRFTGAVRDAARRLCTEHGAEFSALSSSWAPFIVATATLLKTGGRMAFVVPAEIGHAPYARPVLEYMTASFRRVQVVAVREKLFPGLSEDCWLLYAEGYGASTDQVLLSPIERFSYMRRPPIPSRSLAVTIDELHDWGGRLRPFLMPSESREAYRVLAHESIRLGDVARVGIGYVTGANDFFHLRPSEAELWRIPEHNLLPAVRNGKTLSRGRITAEEVERWRANDEPVLLLRIERGERPDRNVTRYLDSPAGKEARESYKCRSRDPWYSVPDVAVPDAFLSYMSGRGPAFVENSAGCVGTNSVHVVRLTGKVKRRQLARSWSSPLTELSCEVEGHPLGGGMLKVEPREAARVLVHPTGDLNEFVDPVQEGIRALRRWRHYGEGTGQV
jgi:adenine-specific DNA-methyltransferase